MIVEPSVSGNMLFWNPKQLHDFSVPTADPHSTDFFGKMAIRTTSTNMLRTNFFALTLLVTVVFTELS